MAKNLLLSLVAVLVGAMGISAQGGRQVMGAPPPIEPPNLYTIPTAHIVESLDLDLSATGVFMGEESVTSTFAGAVGVGDFAQLEIGTTPLISSLSTASNISTVPAGGIKVGVPMWKYWEGIAVSFRRSGTQTENVAMDTARTEYEERSAEMSVVASFTNYPASGEGRASGGARNVPQFKAHLGLTYVDASLDPAPDGLETSFLRPFGGFEMWKGETRTTHSRIMMELGWMPHFRFVDPASQTEAEIEPIWFITGGVRYFYHRYGTFELGVRYQSNYDGIADSAIEAKLRLGWPTHLIRDRMLGL